MQVGCSLTRTIPPWNVLRILFHGEDDNPWVTEFVTPACQDLKVTSLSNHDQMTVVNSLILDVGALQTRVDAAIGRLNASDDHDAQMRAKAVAEFREVLLEATTRLRQKGLHPDAQGTLW